MNVKGWQETHKKEAMIINPYRKEVCGHKFWLISSIIVFSAQWNHIQEQGKKALRFRPSM